MKTECNTDQLEFHSFGRRKIIKTQRGQVSILNTLHSLNF